MIAHSTLPKAEHLAASLFPCLLQKEYLGVAGNAAAYLAVAIESNHNLEIVPIIHGILSCNPELVCGLRPGWHFQQGKLPCLDRGLQRLPLRHRVRFALGILRGQDRSRDELDLPMLLIGLVGRPGGSRCLEAEFEPVSDNSACDRIWIGDRDKGWTFVPLTLEVPQLGRWNAPRFALAPFAPCPNVHEGISVGQELHQPAPGIEPNMDC